MKTSKLPDLSSELLMVAMQDFELVENDDRYNIDMDNWHINKKLEGKCSVCHAGAVMAKTFGVDVRTTIQPSRFDEDVSHKLCAIDSIRQGELESFFRHLELANPFFHSFQDHYYVPQCHGLAYDPEDFFEYLDLDVYGIAGLSNSKDPAHREIYKNWIASFIGILQAEGL
tara:strand:+ start:771 stop:1283 length:513 start_codon:yes stop_codon:yes gene_type:complete